MRQNVSLIGREVTVNDQGQRISHLRLTDVTLLSVLLVLAVRLPVLTVLLVALFHLLLPDLSPVLLDGQHAALVPGEVGDGEHLLVRCRGLGRGRWGDHDLELLPGDPPVPVLVGEGEHLLHLQRVHGGWEELGEG